MRGGAPPLNGANSSPLGSVPGQVWNLQGKAAFVVAGGVGAGQQQVPPPGQSAPTSPAKGPAMYDAFNARRTSGDGQAPKVSLNNATATSTRKPTSSNSEQSVYCNSNW